jgi:hypothetical protein
MNKSEDQVWSKDSWYNMPLILTLLNAIGWLIVYRLVFLPQIEQNKAQTIFLNEQISDIKQKSALSARDIILLVEAIRPNFEVSNYKIKTIDHNTFKLSYTVTNNGTGTITVEKPVISLYENTYAETFDYSNPIPEGDYELISGSIGSLLPKGVSSAVCILKINGDTHKGSKMTYALKVISKADDIYVRYLMRTGGGLLTKTDMDNISGSSRTEWATIVY